jgi:hypothetical protein
MTTDPISTSRMKQNTTSEGTTYVLPPPNGGKILSKRPSKGVNGGFKVPWQASPGEKDKKTDEGASKDAGEEKGGGQQGKTLTPTPTRAPNVEEQQVVQMLSAQKVAAQKRAQAVQVSYIVLRNGVRADDLGEFGKVHHYPNSRESTYPPGHANPEGTTSTSKE